MSSFREQSRTVNLVLLEQWDPIDIGADGPSDEYSSYVPTLIGLIARHATDAQVAEFLGQVESREMGLEISPNAERLEVAARIRAVLADPRAR